MTLSKNQKITLIIFGLLVLGGLAIFFFLRFKKEDAPVVSQTPSQPSVQEEVKAEVTYEDEAGFSFSHPESLEVEDITPEDDEIYYTMISATRRNEELKISAKDTEFDSFESYLEEDQNAPQGLKLYGATSLGKLSANQYTDENKLYTIVVDKGVVYLIEGPKDKYWEDVQNLIVSTWVFAGSKVTPAVNTSPDIIYEAEEVIE